MLNIVKLPDESSDFVGFYHSFRNRYSDFFGEYHGMYNQRCDILHRCVHKDGAFLNRESNGEGLAHRTSLALCKTWQRLILSQQNMKTGRVPAGHEPHIRSCLKNEGFFTE